MEQNSQTRSSITDLFFSDTQHGWALCGGTLGSQGRDLREEQVLLKTEDGGKSWYHAVEMDALCVYFVNQKIGFAAGNYGAVLRTENGGKNWVRCASPEKALGKPVKLPEMTFVFTRLQFLDARHGWALGNFYGDGATHTGGLFFTEDAGQTWRKQTLPIATNTGELVNFHFSDLSHGFLVVETYRGDSRYVTLFLTSDGGASWTERKTNMPGYHITTFANPLVGWTAGVAPARQDGPVFEVAIWRTNDGGATWYEETSLIEGKLYDVFFLDPSHGWAVGEGGMILSYRF